MSDAISNLAGTVCVFFVAALIFVGGVSLGISGQTQIMEKEAVAHGAATYIVTPATGVTTFTWVDCPCEECEARRQAVEAAK